tara:strand:+ start:5337 stop:6311 length:975 start_codon:yes stop_codon:yes gene_type:complete
MGLKTWEERANKLIQIQNCYYEKIIPDSLNGLLIKFYIAAFSFREGNFEVSESKIREVEALLNSSDFDLSESYTEKLNKIKKNKNSLKNEFKYLDKQGFSNLSIRVVDLIRTQDAIRQIEEGKLVNKEGEEIKFSINLPGKGERFLDAKQKKRFEYIHSSIKQLDFTHYNSDTGSFEMLIRFLPIIPEKYKYSINVIESNSRVFRYTKKFYNPDDNLLKIDFLPDWQILEEPPANKVKIEIPNDDRYKVVVTKIGEGELLAEHRIDKSVDIYYLDNFKNKGQTQYEIEYLNNIDTDEGIEKKKNGWEIFFKSIILTMPILLFII